MGILLSLDELHRVLYIRFEGVVTDDVLLKSYDRVREWVSSHGPASSITDFTEIASFEVTANGVSQLAANSPLVPDNFLRIVVAPQDEVFGMTRMFGMLGSGTRNEVHVVRLLADAYQLAGVESPEFHPILYW
jgi:hypothetical protein